MSEFGIGRLVLESETFLPITEEEFNRIAHAKTALLEALAAEEAFDLLLANFSEFEREMLELALGNLMYADRDWTASMDQIQGLNRRLLNLLSACRLYLDHLPQRVNEILGRDAPGWTEIDTTRRAQYDGLLGYRVMEGVRNHIQHRSLPIRAVTHNMQRVGDNGDSFQIRNTLTPLLDVNELEERGAVKRSVIGELRELGERVDLKPLTREYVQGLGAIHERVRAVVGEAVDAAAAVFAAVADRWVTIGEPDRTGLAVIERADSGENLRSIQVFNEPVERYRALVQKNRRLGQFLRHYVSSEVDREAARARAARQRQYPIR